MLEYTEPHEPCETCHNKILPRNQPPCDECPYCDYEHYEPFDVEEKYRGILF